MGAVWGAVWGDARPLQRPAGGNESTKNATSQTWPSNPSWPNPKQSFEPLHLKIPTLLTRSRRHSCTQSLSSAASLTRS